MQNSLTFSLSLMHCLFQIPPFVPPIVEPEMSLQGGATRILFLKSQEMIATHNLVSQQSPASDKIELLRALGLDTFREE